VVFLVYKLWFFLFFFWVFIAKIFGEIPNKVKNEPQIGSSL
jgi:hypothetical protein